MEDGKEVEAGTIGNEGMIGLSVAQGLDFSPTKAISQISGEGLGIPTSQSEKDRSCQLRMLRGH
jgi:hypothetical protein